MKSWKPEYLDHAGFIRTEAFREADKAYPAEDRFRILLNRDSDPEPFAAMHKYFNDLWSRRDALIADFDGASTDGEREKLRVDYSDLKP